MIPYATAEKAHAGDRIARPLTEVQAEAVDAILHAVLGIRLRPAADVFGVVHLHPDRPITPVEEVRCTAALIAVTDSPLAWSEIIWAELVK